MKDFPSCFGENAIQVSDSSSSSNGSSSSSSKSAQNLVTSVYQCRLRGRPCLATVTWSKNLMGQGLSVGIDDDASSHCLCKVEIKPWLFSKKKGCKTLEAHSCKVDVYWDLSAAKFGGGPEPLEGFYVGVVVDRQMVLLLGDLRKEALKKTNSIMVMPNAVFVAKKEHVFGKKVFGNKAVFYDNGPVHDLVIECDTSGVSSGGGGDPCLVIRIDSKTVMQVKRLKWKFRGNHTILVDGVPVEVFWDVYNWLFGGAAASSLGSSAAVFMFRTCLSDEKSWAGQQQQQQRQLSDANVLQWSFSQRFSETKLQGLGFSLVLYAWKNE